MLTQEGRVLLSVTPSPGDEVTGKGTRSSGSVASIKGRMGSAFRSKLAGTAGAQAKTSRLRVDMPNNSLERWYTDIGRGRRS